MKQYRPSKLRDERIRLARDLEERLRVRPLAISLRLDEAEAIISALLREEPK